MNKKTKQALEGSIDKWEKIVGKTGVDKGGDNCTLCDLPSGCIECPVNKDGEHTGCDNTPYEKWSSHHVNAHQQQWSGYCEKGYVIECKICERYAKAELKFLKSLLPCQ